jgi:hypothetical protein
MKEAVEVCKNALNEIHRQICDDNYSIAEISERSDRIIYNFLITIGYEEIAEEWYFLGGLRKWK